MLSLQYIETFFWWYVFCNIIDRCGCGFLFCDQTAIVKQRRRTYFAGVIASVAALYI